MHRVTAKIAEKVTVLLQQGDLDTRPGQQQPEHHPGRPAANHHTGCLVGHESPEIHCRIT